jgi:hypothetical protein
MYAVLQKKKKQMHVLIAHGSTISNSIYIEIKKLYYFQWLSSFKFFPLYMHFLFRGEKQHQQIVCDFASFVIEIDIPVYS